MKYNTAPTLAVFGASAALVLGGCSNGVEQTPPPSTTSQAMPPSPEKDVTCEQSGVLDTYKETGFSKDGHVFTITSIEGGSCVGVYDPQHIEVTLGYLGVGSTFVGPCSPGDKPARLHTLGVGTTKEFVGDVNLTPKGSELISENHIQNCDTEKVPQLGTIYPLPPSSPTTLPPDPIPDYCWQDSRLKGCQNF